MAYRLGAPGDGEHANSFVLSTVVERMSWGAILAGVATAAALQVMLALAGVSLGFAAVGAVGAEAAAEGSVWFWALSSVASLFAGGFVAGRMAGLPLPPSALLHGVLVWAVVSVIGAVVAVGGASAVVEGATRAASGAAQALGSATSELVEMAPERLRPSVPEEIETSLQDALAARDLTPADIRREAQAIYDAVLSEGERARARAIARETARDVLRTPGDAEDDIAQAIDQLFGAGGVVDAQDRETLRDEIAARFDLSEEEAMQIADAWMTQLDQSAEALRETYAEAMATAREAVSDTVEDAAEAAGGAALAMFIGLLAAALGALLGRPEALLFDEAAEGATPAE